MHGHGARSRARRGSAGAAVGVSCERMTETDRLLAASQAENERLRARVAELAHVAAKYEALCAVTPDLLLVIDAQGRYLEIDKTPYFTQEMIDARLGKTVHATFSAEIAEEMVAAVRRTLATGTPQRLEYQVPLAGLSHRRHAAIVTPLSATSVLWFSQDVTSARNLERAQQELRTFEAIVENTPGGVAVLAASGAYRYMNRAYRDLVGLGDAAPDTTSLAHHAGPPSDVRAALAAAQADRTWIGPLTLYTTAGAEVPCQLAITRLGDAGQYAHEFAILVRDLRSMLAAERQRVELREQMVRELSTPLVPLADGVVAMPLIGTLDAGRAQQVLEKLLAGVARLRAHTAILDLTGVRSLDADAADALLRIAGATRLLGARVILTGIGPDVARTLVELQTDLTGITTRDTLQSGIADALRSRG